jgi:hypothetical protein
VSWISLGVGEIYGPLLRYLCLNAYSVCGEIDWCWTFWSLEAINYFFPPTFLIEWEAKCQRLCFFPHPTSLTPRNVSLDPLGVHITQAKNGWFKSSTLFPSPSDDSGTLKWFIPRQLFLVRKYSCIRIISLYMWLAKCCSWMRELFIREFVIFLFRFVTAWPLAVCAG